MEYFYEHVDAEDLSFYFDTSIASFEYLYSLPISERKNYKICLDFRMKGSRGQSFRIVQQITVLELGMKGEVWLVLIINDLSPLHDQDVPARRYMEKLSDGSRVLFAPEDSEVSSPVSPRQLEILGLIARGYASRDIADYLGLSVSTVNNHRQHILSRMKAANTAEAIQMASRLSIL